MTDKYLFNQQSPETSEESWLKKKTAFLNRNLPGTIRQKVTNWFEKKDDILARLAEYETLRQSAGDGDLSETKLKLLEELETAEAENSRLQEKLRIHQNNLIHRRITARTHFKELDRIKQSYLNSASEESDLGADIRFMEEEKARIDGALKNASRSYEDRLAELGKLIKDIKFVSGEIEMWTEKLTNLEAEVPRQYGELDFLGDRINGAFKTLTELGERLASIDFNVKAAYYKNK